MPDLDGLLELIPVGDIAKQFGISESVAEGAVKQILPTLVSGMAANAKDDAGAKSLEKALTKHTGALSGKKTVSEIDTEDGEKIVSNVFGTKKNEVVKAVASKSGEADESLIAKILPIVAPIVLAWVASQFFNKKEETASSSKTTEAASGGGIGDIIGGLVSSKEGQDMIGGLLGGLLGGGKK